MTRRERVLILGLVFAAGMPGPLLAQGGEGDAAGALFDVNLGLSLWTVVIFLGLVFLLGKFAWGPILGAVEARERHIQSALDEAASGREEAARLLEEHRAQLADARRQAQEIIAEGRTAGEQVRREAEERARQEATNIVERARAEIRREKDAAVSELRREAVDVALAAASMLMSENLSSEKDRQLVLGYVKELSESGGAQA